MTLESVASVATILATMVALVGLWLAHRRKPKPAVAVAVSEPTEKRPVCNASQRIRQALNLINVGRTHNALTTAQFAERLGMTSEGEFDALLNGATEPSFQILEKFAAVLGVNSEWLKFGKGEPFMSTEWNDLYPLGCRNRIRDLAPRGIVFVRCKEPEWRSGLVLRIDDLRWVVFGRMWHVSSVVGGTGQGQLVSFYRLIKELRDSRTTSAHLSGCVLEKSDFDRMLSGEIHAGSVLRNCTSNWWDDFTDVYHRQSIAEHYAAWYGEEFVKAQENIRYLLDREDAA